MACGDYSVTVCPANENLCFSELGGIDQCPYELCREGVLDYMISYLE
jgi:hypothetical protein